MTTKTFEKETPGDKTLNDLKQYQLFDTIITWVCIFISMYFTYLVYKKKKEIKDHLVNTTYCKISDHILNMVRFMMLMYTGYYGLEVSLANVTLFKCKNSESGECKDIIEVYRWVQQYSYVIGMLAQIISITQIYEWASMKLIMVWQSTKDFTEVLLLMNDEKETKKFHKEENKLKWWLVMFATICIL